ncbi:2005_t:CDS:2 [Acaulospora morrowiae]|uniref:2005_t:CDS:1 n=1 Tax=Acaulospora morrowiae TaxID=94023 RepID=A0A9N8WEG7_9GLOM|nr:2005_t:CDS:2 [Acaulospora morrowiae]
MALNWAMIASDGKTPVPLPGEKYLFSQEKVVFELDLGGGYPGNPGTYKADGNIFITNQRIIFVSQPSLSYFKSLSIPILNMKEGKLQQPWFGANYYQGLVIPVPNGGLPSPGQMKITFKEGGGVDFSTCHRELILRMAENEGSAAVEHVEPLPIYTPQENSSTSSTAQTTSFDPLAATSSIPPTATTSPLRSRVSSPPVAPEELPPSYDDAINP